MASGDALPVPRKNTAYRVTFGIFKNDGTLITAAAGLDSEVSKDAGTFADCTNEATEIATSSGVYYLDLTSTEMNADTVAVLVKSSSTGAVPVVLTLYPQEAGDIQTNTTYWNGSAVATPTTAGVPEVDITHWNGTAVATPDTAGYPKVTIKSGTGAGELSLTSGRALIQSGIQKGAALTKFQFQMTDSTNHNPATGLTVTGTISKDGGAYAAISPDSITEVSNGMYEVDLSATEMNANNVSLRFTATAADDLNITLRTDP